MARIRANASFSIATGVMAASQRLKDRRGLNSSTSALACGCKLKIELAARSFPVCRSLGSDGGFLQADLSGSI
jgi:hypothetical protein